MTTELLQRLVERRANTWEQAKTLLDTVEEHGGEFSAEQEETWQRLSADLDAKDRRIEELSRLEERNAQAEEVRAEFRTGEPPADEADVTQERSALRQLLRGEIRAAEFQPADSERRALSVGTATAGGDTVPTSFYGRLVQAMIENSGILQTRATVLTTDGGEDLQIPTATAFSTASIVAEAGTIGESDPTFGQVTLGAYKYGFLITISNELLTDTGVDVEGFLAAQGGRALGLGLGADLVTGSGSSKPKGVVTAASSGVTGATGNSGVATAEELIDLYFSVIAPYRRSGEWLMSDKGVAAVRKLKDDNGQLLWQPSLIVGEPNTLLGRPIVVDPNVDDPATSKKSVLFGDFSTYFVRRVNSIRIERSNDYAFDTDQVAFRYLLRADGNLVDTTGAVKYFVGGAS